MEGNEQKMFQVETLLQDWRSGKRAGRRGQEKGVGQ